MRAIFIDGRIKNLQSIIKKIRYRFSDSYFILFGIDKKDINFDISDFDMLDIPGAPETGVAIQEWLNRHIENIDSICIVTDSDTMRPLTEYIIRPNCMLIHKMQKVLLLHYKNKMHHMIKSGNTRKHF